MGLFNCCIRQQASLDDGIPQGSRGTCARSPHQVTQQTKRTDTDVSPDVLAHEAREMITSATVPNSPEAGLDGAEENPGCSKTSQNASMSELDPDHALDLAPEHARDSASEHAQDSTPEHVQDSTLENALSGCMSARDISRLHSEARRNSITAPSESQDSQLHETRQADIEEAVRKVFLEYARFGTRAKTRKTLDVYRFMKLIRECSLMTSPGSAAAVDLIFCKGRTLCAVSTSSIPAYAARARQTVPSQARSSSHYLMNSKSKHVKGGRMDFASFQIALQHIAKLLGVPEADVQRAVATSRGPLVNAVTLPRFVRLHDAASESRQTGGMAKRSSADEHVVERTPGTYPKGLVKSGPKSYGTSGFTPKASARPGSPCFAGNAKA